MSAVAAVALEGDHIGKTRAFRDVDRRVRLVRVAITNVFHEEQDGDVVLVLRCIHAAAQFVAACPEGRVEFGFLEGHGQFLALTWCGARGYSSQHLPRPLSQGRLDRACFRIRKRGDLGKVDLDASRRPS
jgi:hypothetical protein